MLFRETLLKASFAVFSAVASVSMASSVGVEVNGVPLQDYGNSGVGWRYNPPELILDGSAGNYKLFGAARNGEVLVTAASNATYSVTFDNFHLSAPTSTNGCPFVLDPGASVNLYLCGVNSVTSGLWRAAIEVQTGRTLTINADPSDPNGSLFVKGHGSAGIGGSQHKKTGAQNPDPVFGTITINGGTITSEGSTCAAGIGSYRQVTGYKHLKGGTITINGGNVTALGGWSGGAGIGGGSEAHGGTVIINGGTVYADATQGGPGIGGEYGGAVKITGGKVTAIGGFGIISGSIERPIVSPGIACYSKCTYEQTGGTVIARGGDRAHDIGDELTDTTWGTTKITGGSLFLANELIRGIPSGANAGDVLSCLIVTGLSANSPVTLESSDSVIQSYGSNDLYTDEEGKLYLWLPQQRSNVYHFRVVDGLLIYEYSGYLPTILDGSYGFQTAQKVQTIRYYGVKVIINGVSTDVGELGSDLVGWKYNPATSNLTFSANGTYGLTGTNKLGEVQIVTKASSRTDFFVRDLVLEAKKAFTVGSNAQVKMRLEGESSLESSSGAGIEVGATAELILEDHVNAGIGSLSAVGGPGGAGIGGRNNSAAAGTIRINSGDICAKGGNRAAGIGGGVLGKGGTVKISGGIVTATGKGGGAGIGGGYQGDGGTVEVTGGKVTACADGSAGAGIGGGQMRGSVIYRQDGGTVVAKGATDYDDVGGKQGNTGGSVVITGGSLHLAGATKTISPQPVDDAGTKLYCVPLSGFNPDARMTVHDNTDDFLDEDSVFYHSYDIFADSTGTIYPWFSQGPHRLIVTDDADDDTDKASLFRTYVAANGTVTSTKIANRVTNLFINGVEAAFGSDGQEDGWTFADDVVSLTGSRRNFYQLFGTANEIHDVQIVVRTASKDTIELYHVNIVNSKPNMCPLKIQGGYSQVTLKVFGASSFTGGANSAGIEVDPTSWLTIERDNDPTYSGLAGWLEAAGYNGWADVPPEFFVLTVTGGTGGAGIGGSYLMENDGSKISYGDDFILTATNGGLGAEDIGNGGGFSQQVLTITSFTVQDGVAYAEVSNARGNCWYALGWADAPSTPAASYSKPASASWVKADSTGKLPSRLSAPANVSKRFFRVFESLTQP